MLISLPDGSGKEQEEFYKHPYICIVPNQTENFLIALAELKQWHLPQNSLSVTLRRRML